jgi:hypothetical protein
VLTKKEHAEALGKIAESIVNGKEDVVESIANLSNQLINTITEFLKVAIIVKHIHSLECLEEEDQTLLGKEVDKQRDFIHKYPNTESFGSVTEISDALEEISEISVSSVKILNMNVDRLEDIRDRLELIEINNIILQYDESFRKRL